jgi:hypothetical protein
MITEKCYIEDNGTVTRIEVILILGQNLPLKIIEIKYFLHAPVLCTKQYMYSKSKYIFFLFALKWSHFYQRFLKIQKMFYDRKNRIIDYLQGEINENTSI